jgi:hypothetical protein
MRFADLNMTTDYYHEKRSYEWEAGIGGGDRVRPVSLAKYRNKWGSHFDVDPRGQYVKVVYLDHETGEPDVKRPVPEGYVRLAAIRDTWTAAQERLAGVRARHARAQESRVEQIREAISLHDSVRALAGKAGLPLGFTVNSNDPRFLSFKVRATDLETFLKTVETFLKTMETFLKTVETFLKTVERERWQAAQDRVNVTQGGLWGLPGAVGTYATQGLPYPVRAASDEPREARRAGKHVVRHSGGEGNSQG